MSEETQGLNYTRSLSQDLGVLAQLYLVVLRHISQRLLDDGRRRLSPAPRPQPDRQRDTGL